MKIKNDKNFINTKFSIFNLSTYFVRLSIFNFLKENLEFFNGVLLDIGCGEMPYRNFLFNNSRVRKYIGIDIEEAIVYDSKIKPDLYWDGKYVPLNNCSTDSILITEVLEHVPDPQIIFKESFRVLKKGGRIFLTTPFIFPLHESPNDEYRYTPYSIERLAIGAGFKKVDIKPLGGINAALAQILSINKNKFTKLLSIPLIYLLVKIDKKPKLEDGSIFTGLSIVLIK